MKRDAKQVLTELLVLKAQAGSEAAFSQLYETWAKDVFRLARFVVKETQAAEEIAQDAWVSIAKGLDRLDDPALYRAWAFRIVRRRCVDWIRKRKSEKKGRDVLEAESSEAEIQRPNESATKSALSEAIHKLDTDSRLLIHLFYETGLSVTEVAHALDLPAGTVKSRLFAIREKLKQEIERTLK